MSRTVIVAYKPKPGKDAELQAAVRKHLRVLHEQGLVTQPSALVMRATDGTIVEVFEWKSAAAIAQAHSNPAVLALWQEFEAACTYVPLGSLPESRNLFAEFETLADKA